MMAQSQVKGGFSFPLEFIEHKIKISKIQHIYREIAIGLLQVMSFVGGKVFLAFHFFVPELLG